jgi:hypothetical protein
MKIIKDVEFVEDEFWNLRKKSRRVLSNCSLA